MSKVAVVYWSGTGNTEAMANFVAEGAKSAGADVEVFTPDAFSSSMIGDFEGFAFGCPSMGDEVLEEIEFQPMWDDVKNNLNGKKVVLFGSYGWGDGEWMRIWEAEGCCSIIKSYICNEFPDADAEEACKELGGLLA